MNTLNRSPYITHTHSQRAHCRRSHRRWWEMASHAPTPLLSFCLTNEFVFMGVKWKQLVRQITASATHWDQLYYMGAFKLKRKKIWKHHTEYEKNVSDIIWKGVRSHKAWFFYELSEQQDAFCTCQCLVHWQQEGNLFLKLTEGAAVWLNVHSTVSRGVLKQGWTVNLHQNVQFFLLHMLPALELGVT